MNNLNFEHLNTINWLSVALLGVVILLFALRLFSKNRFYKLKPLAFISRILLISGIIAVLAEPFYLEKTETNKIAVLLDLSDSIDSRLGDRALAQITALTNNKEVQLFGFGKEVKELSNSILNKDYDNIRSNFDLEQRNSSNLENAIAFITQYKPTFKNVLLFTDANENIGSLNNLINDNKNLKSKIFPIVPKELNVELDLLEVSYLNAEQIVNTGEKTALHLNIANKTNKTQTGELRILYEGKEFYKQNIKLAETSVFNLKTDTPLILEGPREIQAVFKPRDNTYPTSSKTIFISGKLRDKLFLVSGSREDSRHLELILKENAYQLISKTANEISGEDFENLSNYKGVIFNNISIKALPQDIPSLVKNYVKDGGSFLMIGGNNSFGLGGYRNTSIEDILPVELLPPQEEKKRLNVAVQLVLDKSGSMKEESRIEYSKAAAQEVIQSLKPDDYIGIIGFDNSPFELFPMSIVGQARDKAMQRVELMFPGTTTNLLPALDLGKKRLEQAKAGRKHLIILTDGKLPDGSARRPYYLQMTDEMRRTGITLSTFMIGDEQDLILKEMAQVGGGAFHRTTNLSNLPRLFLEDIKVSTGEKTQKEGQRYQVLVNSDLKSTTLNSFPALLGYVETKIKNKAFLELLVTSKEKKEPLLANWQYEKGKTFAYTSDVSGRWSNYWIDWPKIQIFWTEIINSLISAEKNIDSDFQYDLKFITNKNNLNIETTIYSKTEPNNLELEITNPDNSKNTVKLNKIALGYFNSTIENLKSGIYTATLISNKTAKTPIKFEVNIDNKNEAKNLGINLELLIELAQKNSSKINPDNSDLEKNKSELEEKIKLAPFILLALIVIFLLEIAIRENAI
jgi:Ca-activated chloride channel family protein